MRYPVDVLRKQEISKSEVQGKQIQCGSPAVFTTRRLVGLTEAVCSWLGGGTWVGA